MGVVAAVASLTINFGVIDLVDGFTGYVDQERNQVLDVGWGAVFGVVLPLGLLALLRRPERRIAGVQQTAVVALALALAGVAGESWRYLVLAAGVAGVTAVLGLVVSGGSRPQASADAMTSATLRSVSAASSGLMWAFIHGPPTSVQCDRRLLLS